MSMMAANFRATFSDMKRRKSETLATTLLPRTGTEPIKLMVPWSCVPRPQTFTVVTSFSKADVAVVTRVTSIAPINVPTRERRVFAPSNDPQRLSEKFA